MRCVVLLCVIMFILSCFVELLTSIIRFQRHKEGRAPEDHFLPAVRVGQLLWDEPLQNSQHNEMVRACVSHLELESDPTRVQLYTTTSVRVGNQDLTEELINRLSNLIVIVPYCHLEHMSCFYCIVVW
jgi:hypothetical protein